MLKGRRNITEITELTVKLIILFIPGILATLIIDNLVERRTFKNRTFFISSLLLGFLSYFVSNLGANIIYNLYRLIYLGIKNFSLKIIELDFINSLLNDNKQLNISELVYAVIASIVLAFVFSKIINNAVLHKIARNKKINVSNKFAEEDVWSYLFYNSNKGLKNKIIIRDIKNNLCYKGKIDCHSVDSKEKEILLYDVEIYKNDNTKKSLYKMEKVYFNFNKNEDLIIEIDSEVI